MRLQAGGKTSNGEQLLCLLAQHPFKRSSLSELVSQPRMAFFDVVRELLIPFR